MVNTSTPQYRGMFDQLPLDNVNQFEGTILDEIVQQLHRFIMLPHSHDYTAIALYCAYTYVSGEFDFAPRLVLTSAEKRSGKTRTLEVIQTLVHSPQMTANISPSALYRVIQARPGITILFDEVDTVFNAKLATERSEELRGLLNAGFQKNGTVTRVNLSATDGLEEFSVFAPVVIAAIGNLPDTIADRSIPIRLRRRRYDETVEQFRLSVEAVELEQLGIRLGEHMEQYTGQLVGAQPNTPLNR
ncbi:DUF3631 domain-containing protein [Arcanobacterium phocae]|uniref:DUF3631 domain-containing protein n=2 Tax=Arcanobacterium phocae TaxID=131112 RepID=UPI001C128B92|nr:DUF3631 domain-containing protein [Arcanobacterium phocae]